MQRRVGKRSKIESIGQRVLRPYLPEQHREFFASLPFVVVGSVDEGGRPWASLLTGEPGFAHSPAAEQLHIQARALSGDPLGASWQPGKRLGVLGIELPTRRRNRANVVVREAEEGRLVLEVLQSLGQCPKYIRARPAAQLLNGVGGEATSFTRLDAEARAIIERADTFFVASYVAAREGAPRENVDVSHRGGEAGFLRATDSSILVPDYAGNSFFNTLGNFLMEPRAGILVPDIHKGGFLQLTGLAELLGADSPEVRSMAGAERGWRFTLTAGRRVASMQG